MPACEPHANSYHAKPTDFVHYQALVRRIASYWLEDARVVKTRNRRHLAGEATVGVLPTVAG